MLSVIDGWPVECSVSLIARIDLRNVTYLWRHVEAADRYLSILLELPNPLVLSDRSSAWALVHLELIQLI